MAGKVYTADGSGSAPTGVGVGDYVQTKGGTYQVLDGSQYQGMNPDQLASSGVGFNPTTGLYSKKVTTTSDPYSPVNVSFDTNAWKTNYMNQMQGQLDADYASSTGDLSKTFNTNVNKYDTQKKEVNTKYEDNIAQLQKDTYIQNILAKQNASSRGLTSSAQGIAMGQNVINQANSTSAGLWKSKQQTIDGINSAINLLSSNYNIDKDTLKRTYDATKLAKMSEVELAALEQQLKIDMSNADNMNAWGMTKYQTENSNAQAEKDRQLQLYLASLSGGGSGGSGKGSSQYDAETNAALADEQNAYMTQMYGEDWRTKFTAGEMRSINNALIRLHSGETDISDYYRTVNTHWNAVQSRAAKGTEEERNKTIIPGNSTTPMSRTDAYKRIFGRE